MKRFLIYSTLLTFILLVGCQNESPINGPQNSEIQKSQTAEPQWIGLPQSDDQTLSKKFLTFNYFNADKGGDLTIDVTYTTIMGKEIHAFSNISFPPGGLKKNGFVMMIIDDRTGVAEFLPHQSFNKPAVLNQTFVGLNLDGLDPNLIKLYYMDDDGSYVEMTCDQLIVDINEGTIQVVNGLIPHFSIYGFGI